MTTTGSAYETTGQRQWSPDRGGIITSLEDFEAFPWPSAEAGALYVAGTGTSGQSLEEAIDEISGALPKGMGLILCTDGIFERFTKDLMGYETFCLKLYDEPKLIESMFAKTGELWLGMYERMAAYRQVGALWLADDIAYSEGLLFSPRVMRQHLFPWYRLIGEVAARAKKPFLFHSDGDLRLILEDLVGCGFQALQPIEPKAMDIRELKRDYGGRLCLIGNIDLGSTLTLGTPDEVRAEVRAHLQDLAPGGGYCVGSSNSVTNYVPLANFRAMIEATFTYGRYPMTVIGSNT